MKFNVEKQYLKYCTLVFLFAAIISGTFIVMSNIYIIYKTVLHSILKFISVIMPLNIGLVIAYILNKPMVAIERQVLKLKTKKRNISKKSTRMISLTIIYTGICTFFIFIGNYIFPNIKNNAVVLVNKFPEYASAAEKYVISWAKGMSFFSEFTKHLNASKIGKVADKFSDISYPVLNFIIHNISNITMSLLNLVIGTIISFYLLKDKEKFVNGFNSFIKLYFSEKNRYRLNIVLQEVDNIMGQFMLGLITESVFVGIIITVALLIRGFDFSFLIGFCFVLFNMIPYFGTYIMMVLIFLLGLFQGQDMATTSVIIFFIIHLVDANIIAPKIVGDKVGVEPILIMVGITVGGSYFGIFGMILAVPMVAIIKVLILRIVRNKKAALEQKQPV